MKRFKILFLCTGNSARSIFAEYLMKKTAPAAFDAVSAGSNPKPAPHPMALRVLHDTFGIDASNARSKSWDEFGRVEFDFVITLCDDAKETCPVWPGHPIIAHWGSADPARFQGDEQATFHAFWVTAQQINRRLELFTSLPFDKLDALRLEAATKNIANQE